MHMETLLEEKVSDGLHSQLTTAEEIPQHSQMVFVLVQGIFVLVQEVFDFVLGPPPPFRNTP